MHKHSAHHRIALESVFLLVATLLATACFLWLMFLGGGLSSPTSNHYKVAAVLPNAGAQLVTGARVTMAGVTVGTVKSVSRHGAGAVVQMDLTDSRVTPLPADSRAQLRERTPLGENYMAILAGSSRRTLPSGGVIPLRQVAQSVDVDQVLSMLDGSARRGARRLIQGVGNAVGGRGARINVLVGGTAGTLSSGSDVVNAVYGERQQISQLIAQLGDVASGLGDRAGEIQTLANGGLTTFRAIAARDAALRSLLAVLPSTLQQVRTTTDKLSNVTGVISPMLFNLAGTITAARPAARALAPAAKTLGGVFHALGGASPPLGGTLRRLEQLAPPAAAALPRLRQTLCQVNPMLTYIRPYTPDVLSLVEEFGSSTNNWDTIGHTVRLTATINDEALVGLPASINNSVQTLLHSGLLAKVNGLTYDPYPAPGTAATPPKTIVRGPAELQALTGYVYPHVVPRCHVPTP